MNTSNKKLKVLLVNPKDSYVLGTPPLGIGYLISYNNKMDNNEVNFHDENFIPQSRLDMALLKCVETYKPDFIGLTFPSSTIKRIAQIVKIVKELSTDITLFAGGYHPTSEPKATLKIFPEFDFLVLGQAEKTFANLKKNWKQLPGIAYFNNSNEFVTTGNNGSIDNLDEIPIIDRKIYDKKYFLPSYSIPGVYGKTVTIMTSRGCPYNCGFCSNILLQKKVKFHSIDYVLSEIENILSEFPGVDYLYFLDVMFLANWKRTQALCEALIETNILKKKKWAAVVSANVVTHERIKLLKAAGCFYLSFGFESNSSNSLRLMQKKATAKDNENAVKICKENGILCNSAFLFGIPGETENDLQKTIDFVKKHNIFSTGINAMKPLPGSPFYDKFIRNGILKKDIETWHNISSIHHFSGFFNDKIDEHIYERFIKEFNAIIKRRSVINDIKVNYKNLIKYDKIETIKKIKKIVKYYSFPF